MTRSIGLATLVLLVGINPASAQAPPINPLDQAIGYVQEAKRNYQGAVKDYTCIFVAKENIKGRVNEDHYMQFKFREAPFSVAMKWLGPTTVAGQEVCFIKGKNNDQLRVHSKGILGVAGFVSVAPNDPRVKEQSRHSIHEAGLGHLIDSTLVSMGNDKKHGKTLVKIAEFDFDNRRCYRIESTRTARLPDFYSYRSVIFLEKVSKYPIRNENYAWPVQGGNPNGELMETFSFTQLRFNVGLTEQDFAK